MRIETMICRVTCLVWLLLVSSGAVWAGDMPDCDSGEKWCQIGSDEYICWPAGENCPNPLDMQSAFEIELDGPDLASGTRATRERTVTLRHKGCSTCKSSPLVQLPGTIEGVELLSSQFTGGVSRTEVRTLGKVMFERTCFGFVTTRCGSVARTYLVSFQAPEPDPETADGP